MGELCEWNPATNEPALFGDGEHIGCCNEATISVGRVKNWHLCSSCAELPHFRRMTVRVPIQRKPTGFYVAISKKRPGKGFASVVADDPKGVKQFYRDYVGHEIRHVDGDEMQRLMID